MKIAGFLIHIVPVLLTGNIFGQTRLNIISETDHAKLAYASISNLTRGNTYSANNLGEIELKTNAGDTLRITYVGYKPAIYVSTTNEIRTIILSRISSTLAPVVITNCHKHKTLTISNTENQPEFIGGFAGYGYNYGASNAQYAVLLRSLKPGAMFNKFSFWLINKFGPDSAILAPFLVTLYEVNDTDSLPLRPLLENPIVYFPKKEGKQTIQLDSLQIRIPENGVYISFQYIMDERYAWKYTLRKNGPNSDDTTITRYGVILKGVYDTGYTSANFNSIQNKWIKLNPREAIKFEAVLSYCKP